MVNIMFFWDVIRYGSVDNCREDARQQVYPECWNLFTVLCNVTPYNTVNVIATTMRTSYQISLLVVCYIILCTESLTVSLHHPQFLIHCCVNCAFHKERNK